MWCWGSDLGNYSQKQTNLGISGSYGDNFFRLSSRCPPAAPPWTDGFTSWWLIATVPDSGGQMVTSTPLQSEGDLFVRQVVWWCTFPCALSGYWDEEKHVCVKFLQWWSIVSQGNLHNDLGILSVCFQCANSIQTEMWVFESVKRPQYEIFTVTSFLFNLKSPDKLNARFYFVLWPRSFQFRCLVQTSWSVKKEMTCWNRP